MTGMSWKGICFSPQGSGRFTAGASSFSTKKASNHLTPPTPSLSVLSDVVVLSVVILSVLLVVIS